MVRGPPGGYFPDTKNSILIVSEGKIHWTYKLFRCMGMKVFSRSHLPGWLHWGYQRLVNLVVGEGVGMGRRSIKFGGGGTLAPTGCLFSPVEDSTAGVFL